MKARVLRFDTAEHARAEALLPWYANGTLGAPERAAVEAHLARCTRCRADLAFQARLRRLGESLPTPTDAAAPADEALFARLHAEVRAAGTRREAGAFGRRLGGWLQGAAALAVGLALLVAAVPPAPFRALGDGPASAAANALVVFRPEATDTQIRAALRSADARVVGGPTASDAYLLQLAHPGTAALDRLRAEPGVARAESLVGGGAR